MRAAFGGDSALPNLYFIPRSGTMGARIETPEGSKVLFSGYDYLGLSRDPRVVAATKDALDTYGTHAGAARMVGGETRLHGELEESLARLTGHEAAVVGVSGYAINVSVISYLLGKNDLLVHDSMMHNSGVMGGVQSGARRLAFPHNDYDALERILTENRPRAERAMILVEGAYSMDGDLPDLPRLIALRDKHQCWLMVDEAHSYGVLGTTGRGLAEHWGLDPRLVDISMGTLSKSLASCGGFIAGSQVLVDLLRTFAPGILMYSTGISPANAAAARAAVEILLVEPERVARLRRNSAHFCLAARERGLDIGLATGLVPIVPVMIGQDQKAFAVAGRLHRSGIIAHPIVHPVVPPGSARIRFFITADHGEAEIDRALDIVADELQ
jgi:8-amino-7-oxononanoate synthase